MYDAANPFIYLISTPPPLLELPYLINLVQVGLCPHCNKVLNKKGKGVHRN